MPYKTLPPEGNEEFEHFLEIAKKQYPDDEEISHKVAWDMLKKAGWVKEADGMWHKESKA